MFPIRDTIPSQNRPIVTLSLITVNLVVFILEILVPTYEQQNFLMSLGLIPAGLTLNDAPFLGQLERLPTLITYQFLHGGLAHFIGNMWSLWLFGDNVEDRMGHIKFLFFYLLSGVMAGLIHSLINPLSTVPVVGASGSLAGVMGAYFILFPFARIVFLSPIIFIPFFFELPAALYLGLWFLTQVFWATYSVVGSLTIMPIAFWAHLGGFLAGVFLHRLFLVPKYKFRSRPFRYLKF